MLDLGATTIWELYDPTEDFPQHYSMYDKKYAKSLCHAWGANPVYLFGRYFLGVRPLTAAYETYEVTPDRGGLTWIKGTVPTPKGEVKVEATAKKITVHTPGSKGGILRFESKRRPKADKGEITKTGKTTYELKLEQPNTTYTVRL